MDSCTPYATPIKKGERLSKFQCPQNDVERIKMDKISYASTIDNLMHAQVCNHLDIAFAISVLGSYLSDLGKEHWKVAKKVMRYLQGTKHHMLTFRKFDPFEIVGYIDSTMHPIQIIVNPLQVTSL